jgi:hypothetical protein
MIASEALSGWLADRAAQAETAGKAEHVARRVRDLPALSRLKERLPDAEKEGAGAALALAEEFIVDAAAIRQVADALISAARDDPYFRPHFTLGANEVHSGLLLFERPALTVLLATMSADAIAAKRAERSGGASLIFTGRQALFHFIHGGGAILSFWEAPPIEAGFTARTSGRCRLVERRRVEDGETLSLDGRRFTFIIEEADRDIVFLQAVTPLGSGPLTVEYDSATLGFVGASSTDEVRSRTEMMLALLRLMDRRDAVPVFLELLASEHFHHRWQTMREFLALDAEAALPHLRAMALGDPHPEVRQAAASTLEQFFPKDALKEEIALCLS